MVPIPEVVEVLQQRIACRTVDDSIRMLKYLVVIGNRLLRMHLRKKRVRCTFGGARFVYAGVIGINIGKISCGEFEVGDDLRVDLFNGSPRQLRLFRSC